MREDTPVIPHSELVAIWLALCAFFALIAALATLERYCARRAARRTTSRLWREIGEILAKVESRNGEGE